MLSWSILIKILELGRFVLYRIVFIINTRNYDVSCYLGLPLSLLLELRRFMLSKMDFIIDTRTKTLHVI